MNKLPELDPDTMVYRGLDILDIYPPGCCDMCGAEDVTTYVTDYILACRNCLEELADEYGDKAEGGE